MKPYRLVTAEQIREMDHRAITEYGIPGSVLMESAGAAVVDALLARCGTLAGRQILICCGGGNNGGDGYVIARRLALLGARPVVAMLASPAALTGDAMLHYQVLQNTAVCPIIQWDSETQPLPAPFGEIDIIVDALLGTGLSSAPRAAFAAAIHSINAARQRNPRLVVAAVDVPSGIDSDTGASPGAAIRADFTATFARPKVGMYLPPASEHTGDILVSDIGFCWDLIEPQGAPQITPDTVFNVLLDARRLESNKGDFGHVGIIAGSRGMTGAPVMAARAAQRAGAGLVTVLTAASAQASVSVRLDEQMTMPLAEDHSGAISEAAFDAVKSFAIRASALCIGPGLTMATGTATLVKRILTELDIPAVVDADGLNILAADASIAVGRSNTSVWVLTPHPGEAARLLGTSAENVQSNRIASVCEIARRYHAVVLLKGRYTLVAGPDGEILVNTTGNPGMASGGMGDTLTGIVAAFLAALARKGALNPHSALHCTAAAAAIHGLAGDIALRKYGEIGLTAGDVGAAIAEAILETQHRLAATS